ncbi:MAG: FAD-dependent monooxygenase [Pseudomonadota bacterium]
MTWTFPLQKAIAQAMTSIHYDIVIIGGGLAGQSLAAALSHHDFSVALIEAAALGKKDDRVTALNASSATFYDSIGVWKHLEAHAQPMHDVVVVDGPNGRPLSFEGDGTESTRASDAAHGHVVHNQVILEGLTKACKAARSLDIYTGGTAAVEAEEAGGLTLLLSGGSNAGKRIHGAVVCAADGGRSALRRWAGIDSLTRDYGQANITATLTHDNAHHGVGFQRFMPQGPVAFIPMQGQHSSLAWTVSQESAPDIMALDHAAFLRLLSAQIFGQNAADPADPRGPLTATGPRSTYPIKANIANRFHGERLMLVGDAAHVIHPLAGQGFNLSVRDIALATELFLDTRAVGGDLGSQRLLRAYTSRRRPDILATFGATDMLNRAYSTTAMGWTALRQVAMRLGRRQPRLRTVFSQQAQGSLLGLPRLMKS